MIPIRLKHSTGADKHLDKQDAGHAVRAEQERAPHVTSRGDRARSTYHITEHTTKSNFQVHHTNNISHHDPNTMKYNESKCAENT